MKKINYQFLGIFYISLFVMFISCKTVDLQEIHKNDIETTEKTEIEDNTAITDFFVEEALKENDISTSVIVLEPPEVRNNASAINNSIKLTGKEALQQHLKDITVVPEYQNGRLKGFLYKENSVYEIQCQTYHSTLIQFEPGEEMLEMPYISEPDVWRISRGIGVKNGLPTQHLIIKPDYTNLVSTLIVITNRRVYQMELKSFNDRYMPIVQWIYPQGITDTATWAQYEQNKNIATVFRGINPEYLSFDYKMQHSIFNKPIWLPKQVYDDGYKTYIVLNEKSLIMKYPIVFNHKNEIINYRTEKNIMIIDQLIEKVTLRLGNQKVSIEKKKTTAAGSETENTSTEE